MKYVGSVLLVTITVMLMACESAIGIIIDTLGIGIDPNRPLICLDSIPWTNSDGDCDNDGVINGEDHFKFNSCASVDTDNDGNPDSLHDPSIVTACDPEINTLIPEDGSSQPLPPGTTEAEDSDQDGINDTDRDGNPLDRFPMNACASVDTDGDGDPDSILVPGAPDTPESCTVEDAAMLTADIDNDGDSTDNIADNCPLTPNIDQSNVDGDTFGDACDLDADNDGLIDIRTVEDLSDIRFNLVGTSRRSSVGDSGTIDGAPTSATTECTTATSDGVYLCGYELMNDLDFGEAADYADGSVNMNWRPTDAGGNPVSAETAVNIGFVPIGNNISEDGSDRFGAIFEGNGYTISGLYINEAADIVGLFGYVTSSGVIRNLGLAAAFARGSTNLGTLVGLNDGQVSATWSKGSVLSAGNSAGGLVGNNNGTINASWSGATVMGGSIGSGGLVGENRGVITATYATGNVIGNDRAGGLVGRNIASGSINASWSSGQVSSLPAGGLVGENSATVLFSFWDTERSGQSSSSGTGATGLTSDQMRSTTGTYPNFSSFYGGDTNPFELTDGRYPRLKQWTGSGSDSIIGTSDDAYSATLLDGQD